MSNYGKKSYWNDRYSRVGPCDWITGSDYAIFRTLFTPRFLSNMMASIPGGEIIVKELHEFPHVTSNLEDGCVHGEETWIHNNSLPKNKHEFPMLQRARVLNVGCGNSELGANMLHNGFANVVNVDWSEVVIREMREKYDESFFKELRRCIETEDLLRDSLRLEPRDDVSPLHGNTCAPKMTFEVADITEGLPSHPDGSFDLIICKKTLDMILCGAGSVAGARKMMTECFRLLNENSGVLMIFSNGKPEDRAIYFEKDGWTGVENIKLPSPHQQKETLSHEK